MWHKILEEKEEWDGQPLQISGLWGNPEDMDPEVRREMKMKRFRAYLAEVRSKAKNATTKS